MTTSTPARPLDPAEGDRLAGVIGDKTVLFMANHGITPVGATVADCLWTGFITSSARHRFSSTRCGRDSP